MDANARAIVIALNRIAHYARERWSEPFAIASNQQHFDPLLLGRAAINVFAKAQTEINEALLGAVDVTLMLWATSLALWRRSQVAYRFDPDVWEELIATSVERTPITALRMPHEAALIIPPAPLTLPRANGENFVIRAILATVGEFHRHEVKIVLIDDDVVRNLGDVMVHHSPRRGRMPREAFEFPPTYGLYLPLTGETVGEALRAAVQNAILWQKTLAPAETNNADIERQMHLITAMTVNALLLIISPGCDIIDEPSHCPPSPRQSHDRPRDRGRADAPQPRATEATFRTVGAVWGATLRLARERAHDASAPHGDTGDGVRASPRPHLRRGHWRWQACGPRHSDRRLQWIHPILVGAEYAEGSIPAVIRPVKR